MEDKTFSVREDSGRRLDAAARDLMSRDSALSYRAALDLAGEQFPQLYASYTTGRRETAVVKDEKVYQLSGAARELALLQTDVDRVRFLANGILDHHAKLKAGGPTSSAGIG